MQHEPMTAEVIEQFENDQIAHYKALRDHYETQALRSAFDNRQLVKQNMRLQQRIEELEKQAAEPELIPPTKPTDKVVTIGKKKEE